MDKAVAGRGERNTAIWGNMMTTGEQQRWGDTSRLDEQAEMRDNGYDDGTDGSGGKQ